MSLPLSAQGEFARVIPLLESMLDNTAGSLVKGFAAEVGYHDIYAMLADAAAHQRDADALRRYAPQAEQAAARLEHGFYQAVAHRAWGVAHRLAGAHAESEARLAQALELFRQLDARWQMGRTLFELGELAQARARPLEARNHFTQALALFEAMGAMPDVARARAALNLTKD